MGVRHLLCEGWLAISHCQDERKKKYKYSAVLPKSSCGFHNIGGGHTKKEQVTQVKEVH